MYAVFEDGSRQYRVSEGDFVTLDYRDVEKGTRLVQPIVGGTRIGAEVEDHSSTKPVIQKFRRRKNYRRLKGHRQWYTKVQVRSILLPGQETPASAPAPGQP